MIITDTTATGYLRVETIESIMDVIKDKKIYSSNINNNKSYQDQVLLREYLKDYCFELRNYKRNYKNKKNVEAYRIEYMLPKGIGIKGNRTKIIELVKEIVNNFSQGQAVNYFTMIEFDFRFTFIVIYVLDRHYYPDGKEITLTRTYTQYKDKVTNKLITKDEYETKKNGYIVFTDGEEYTKTIIMSDKIRFEGVLNFSNPFSFVYNLRALKRTVALFQAKVFGMKVVLVPNYFKKMSYKQLIEKNGAIFRTNKKQNKYNKYYYYKRRKLRAYNNFIDHINFKLMALKVLNETLFNELFDSTKEKLITLKEIKNISKFEEFVNAQMT